MPPWWWSLILAAVGITGLWLAGSGRRIAWAIGVAAQLLWLAYAVATRQYGFLLTAVAYGVVNARNWLAWRPTPTEEPAPVPVDWDRWLSEARAYLEALSNDRPAPVAYIFTNPANGDQHSLRPEDVRVVHGFNGRRADCTCPPGECPWDRRQVQPQELADFLVEVAEPLIRPHWSPVLARDLLEKYSITERSTT